jgi:hypothetical protein
MRGDGRPLLGRRALLGALTAMVLAAPRVARAQDPTGALRDLAESTDFRVRVTAALYLGKTRPPGAREALERALGDGHPAVRVAAATALGALGDPSAIGALSRRLGSESSASVKAQIQSTIEALRAARSSHGGDGDAAGAVVGGGGAAGVRYIVRLGSMRNPSGVRGDDLRRVLREAAFSRAHGLRGGAVVDGDAAAVAAASQRHVPIITLDGSLTQVLESQVAGSVQIQARVEFAVRKEQTLKGTLSGAATTFGSSPSISDQSRRQLQNDAVDGAVQSALRGADQGLIVATL